MIDHNVVRDLDRDDRPGVARQSEPRYLSETELVALLAKMGDTFRPVVIVCLYAGLRISETLGLRWRDLDLKAGSIDVAGQLGPDGRHVSTKTESSEATVAMLPIVKRELVAHRARVAGQNLARVRPDAFVFTTMRGKPQSRRNALRAIHNAGTRPG